jgi:hypothetical protein
MEPNAGASGLEEIGNLTWRSHLCLFYETKHELLDDERYFKGGQIELVSHTDLYLKKNGFDADHVLQAWTEKTEGALARGYSGIRSAGNTFWLDKHLGKPFAEYAARGVESAGKIKIKLLCTYGLERGSAEIVLDMIQQHHFTLSRRWRKSERLVELLSTEPQEVCRVAARYLSVCTEAHEGRLGYIY